MSVTECDKYGDPNRGCGVEYAVVAKCIYNEDGSLSRSSLLEFMEVTPNGKNVVYTEPENYFIGNDVDAGILNEVDYSGTIYTIATKPKKLTEKEAKAEKEKWSFGHCSFDEVDLSKANKISNVYRPCINFYVDCSGSYSEDFGTGTQEDPFNRVGIIFKHRELYEIIEQAKKSCFMIRLLVSGNITHIYNGPYFGTTYNYYDGVANHFLKKVVIESLTGDSIDVAPTASFGPRVGAILKKFNFSKRIRDPENTIFNDCTFIVNEESAALAHAFFCDFIRCNFSATRTGTNEVVVYGVHDVGNSNFINCKISVEGYTTRDCAKVEVHGVDYTYPPYFYRASISAAAHATQAVERACYETIFCYGVRSEYGGGTYELCNISAKATLSYSGDKKDLALCQAAPTDGRDSIIGGSQSSPYVNRVCPAD